MPRRFTIPDALQLLFVLVIVLVALIVLVLMITLLVVVLFHFLSPPKVFGVILASNPQNIRTFPGKGVVRAKSLC